MVSGTAVPPEPGSAGVSRTRGRVLWMIQPTPEQDAVLTRTERFAYRAGDLFSRRLPWLSTAVNLGCGRWVVRAFAGRRLVAHGLENLKDVGRSDRLPCGWSSAAWSGSPRWPSSPSMRCPGPGIARAMGVDRRIPATRGQQLRPSLKYARAERCGRSSLMAIP